MHVVLGQQVTDRAFIRVEATDHDERVPSAIGLFGTFRAAVRMRLRVVPDGQPEPAQRRAREQGVLLGWCERLRVTRGFGWHLRRWLRWCGDLLEFERREARELPLRVLLQIG